MTLTASQSILIIAVCALCTFLERALPFLIFGSRPVPEIVRYLGRVLPMAVMTTLTVYCLRGISFAAVGSFLPELIATTVVVGLHLWRHDTFLSIVGGTAVYIVLVQLVFA